MSVVWGKKGKSMPELAYRKLVLLALLLPSLLIIVSCSSNKIRPLSTVEIAQQLIKDQQNSANGNEKSPLKIHFIQPGKAVIGKPMEIELELVPRQDYPLLTVAYQVNDGLKFNKRWLIQQQDTIIRKLSDVKSDVIYPQRLTITPVTGGVLNLDIYILYQDQKEQKASRHVITLSIGDALKKHNGERIKL